MFTDPLFTQARHQARPLLPVVERGAEAAGGRLARPVARQARRRTGVGAADLVHAALGSACPKRPCKLPTVRQYTKAFKAFRTRWPQVKVINPWNEANHRSQPTFKNPKRAAQFYNVVRANCRGCKIVAADVIDESNMESWLQGLQADREEAAHLGPPQLPRHEQAQGPAARRHEAAAEGREGRGLAHRDRRHREVRAARTATRCSRQSRARANARDEADVRAREALPEPHQAALHLPLEAVRAETTASTPGWCAADGTARPAYRTVRNAAPHAHLQPVGGIPAASGSGGRGCTSSPMCGRASRSCSRRRSPAGWTWSSSATSRRATTSSSRAAAVFRRLCDEHGALFWLNDRPDLVGGVRRRRRARGAGRHARRRARAARWPRMCSSASPPTRPAQLDRALAEGVADQLSVGPVWETPTKEGRPAAGLDYVRYAARARGRPALVRDRRDRPR